MNPAEKDLVARMGFAVAINGLYLNLFPSSEDVHIVPGTESCPEYSWTNKDVTIRGDCFAHDETAVTARITTVENHNAVPLYEYPPSQHNLWEVQKKYEQMHTKKNAGSVAGVQNDRKET